jgi:hypothetical protein
MQKIVNNKILLMLSLSIMIMLVACKHNVKQNEVIKTPVKDSTDRTNNFYDNEDTFGLPLSVINVGGEVANPGTVDFSSLPLHSVIVKETLLDSVGDQFLGAYRYDGYSLLDILDLFVIDKSNVEEFNPIIDLFVEIENDEGDKVVLSWGEIYYPSHLNEIIIASQVMRIVPSKSKDQWPLPEESKLVVATDLITERNISSPSKITVRSYPRSFRTVKGLDPLYSPDIKIYDNDTLLETLTQYPSEMSVEQYNTIFYGRGRGIHSTQPFYGVLLKDILATHFDNNRESLMKGIFLVVAADGYRGVFTYGEMMNRNDQSEVLLICNPEVKTDGIFRLFPAGDFFSDRAIKGVSAIYYDEDINL